MTDQLAQLQTRRLNLLDELHDLRAQRLRTAGRVLSDTLRGPIETAIRQKQRELSQVTDQLTRAREESMPIR